jgi:hypothetical protein
MSAEEYPRPRKDTSEFLFLYPFYYRGGKVIANSPQHAFEANKRRADSLALRLVSLLQVYDTFPPLKLSDPCGIYPNLSAQLSGGENIWNINKGYRVTMKPVLRDEYIFPTSARWLGALEIYNHDPDLYIREITLNQPGEGKKLRLDRYPATRPDDNDSYLANQQAMNFIGMVEDYLNQFEKRRFTVI